MNGVIDDALCLYLFPHSLTHHATAWFDRLPRNSITTFEKMAKMFLGKYFPPSMVTKLRNETTNFHQYPNEALFEAWECYKLSIDCCPNHNMLPVTQIDTFYNGLTLRHRDTINAVADGTFLKRRPEECFDLIGNICLAIGNNQGRNQFFQGASHGQNPPPAYQAPAYQAPGYQASIQQALITQPQVVTTTDQFMKMNTASSLGSGTLPSNIITKPKEDLKGITTRIGIAYKGPTIPTTSSHPKVVERETKVTKDTMLPTNNGSTKEVQHPVVQVEIQVPNYEHVVAPVVEPVQAPVSAPRSNPKPSIPHPSRLHDQKLRDKANDKKEKFFQIFQDLNFKISFADALILMPKFGPTIKSLLTNEEKLFELAKTPLNERCSAVLLKKLPKKLGDPGKFLIPCDFSGMDVCLALADLGTNINLMPLFVWNKLSLPELSPTCMTLELADRSISHLVGVAEDVFVKVGTGNPTPSMEPIVSTSSPTLTPFGDRDFFLEETDAFLAIDDEPISPKINNSYYDSEEDILLLEEFLNDDPSSPPLPSQELKVVEPNNEKSSIDEPPMVKLKDLAPHLEYAFLEGDDKLPVIIAKDLKDEEKTAIIKVLKSHKQALAWKLSDIKGINLEFYTHKILMKDDFKLAVQYQRRVNQKIHEVIKKEEKSHFMVKEGLVFGHKISKNGIEVDKAKVDVIAKLPHPTTVKGIRSFLGHAGFYQRFIQDFSKIARPMTRLLEKDTPFIFSKECIEAFQSLKKKLTKAPILVAPDWDLPFQLMCDATDFAIGAVLGQRKTMTDAKMPSRDCSGGFSSFNNLISSSAIKKEPRTYSPTMGKMFLGKYFPPFMVTKLINEITNFRQRPDESLFEAWERYKLSID
nr:reverse transcriptase domain-containing protein [Tanacetum cinerariifolium]